MYNVLHLFAVARSGFRDMLPALKSAFDADPTDDRMSAVYGPAPRIAVLGLALVGALLGAVFGYWVPDLPGTPVKHHVNWPAVGAGLIFAALLRRFLFSKKPTIEDFPWLAASVIPAIGLVVLLNLIASLVQFTIDDLRFGSLFASSLDSGYGGEGSRFGRILVAATNALGVAAAMTIAIGALCFSRNWSRALIDLAVRLLVFRILIWVTALVTIEIGVVGLVVGGIINGLTGWSLPDWVETLADQISYAVLLTTVYLAVIGGTWVVCRGSMRELIETGHVDILKGIGALATKPKKPKRGTKTKQTD